MTGVTREATPDCCGKEVYFVFLVMIVLFIVLSRNKLNFSFAAVGCRGQGAVSEVGLEVLWFRVWV